MRFSDWINQSLQSRPYVTVALSGGSTPIKLFQIWADEYRTRIDWSRIHFFWGDERCVPHESPESNFGEANRIWLSHVDIPASNIHPIMGDADPIQEAIRYQSEIGRWVPAVDGVPQFDLILLGMGSDGHTASIFPDQMELLTSDQLCAVAEHPVSGQKRISITGRLIDHGLWVAFLIAGKDKQETLDQVLTQKGDYQKFPAAMIEAKQVDFFVDQAAWPDEIQ